MRSNNYLGLLIIGLAFTLLGAQATAKESPGIEDHSNSVTFGLYASRSTPKSSGSSGTTTAPPTTWTEVEYICSPESGSDGRGAGCGETNLCPNGEVLQAVRTFRRDAQGNQNIISAPLVCGPPPATQDVRATLEQEIFRHRPVSPKPRTLAEKGNPHQYWSLVNAHTVFWSEAAVYEAPSILLGANVRMRLMPESYEWRYGDGATSRSNSPGKPDPKGAAFELGQQGVDPSQQGFITHKYRKTMGTGNGCKPYPVTIAITWRGEYSVSGGDWQPLAPRITTTSDPLPLAIYQARSELIKPDGIPNKDKGNKFSCPRTS